MNVEPKEFWENKILHWEAGRYHTEKEKFNLLEVFANRASRSLRFRLQIALKLLQPSVAGKDIVEVGCGSGLLVEQLFNFGIRSYHGIDIAENAIKRAHKNTETLSEKPLKLSVGDVGADYAITEPDNTVVFSLGLLDWLQDSELKTLFQQSQGAHFLHAIAEKRFSVQQWIHRAYVHLAYGHRTGSYVPRYYPARDIAQLAQAVKARPVYVYRDRRLSFGAILSSLPIGERVL